MPAHWLQMFVVHENIGVFVNHPFNVQTQWNQMRHTIRIIFRWDGIVLPLQFNDHRYGIDRTFVVHLGNPLAKTACSTPITVIHGTCTIWHFCLFCMIGWFFRGNFNLNGRYFTTTALTSLLEELLRWLSINPVISKRHEMMFFTLFQNNINFNLWLTERFYGN